MKGWITPTDVFHECTLDSLPEELGDIGVPTIGFLERDPAKRRAACEEIRRCWLFKHGCIEVDGFHRLARFRGRSDRLIAAWPKMVELSEPYAGLTVEKVNVE